MSKDPDDLGQPAFNDEDFNFSKFIKNSKYQEEDKIDKVSSEVITCLVVEAIRYELPGDLETYAKVTALTVLKLGRLVNQMFGKDTSKAFTKAVIACIEQQEEDK